MDYSEHLVAKTLLEQLKTKCDLLVARQLQLLEQAMKEVNLKESLDKKC